MEKRAVIAIAISFLILVGWTYLFPPPERPETEPQGATDVVTDAPVERLADRPETGARDAEREPGETAAFEPGDAIEASIEDLVEVSTSLFDLTLSNRGGRVVSWKLLDYTTPSGEPLELVPRFAERAPLPLAVEIDRPEIEGEINEALFHVERTSVQAGDGTGPGERIAFEWADGRGLVVRKALTIRDGSYLVDVDLEVEDRGRRLPARLAIGPGFAAQEPSDGRSNYYYDGQAVWNTGGRVTRRAKRKLSEGGGFAGNVRWVGLEDQYFAALVIPGRSPSEVRWRPVELTALPALGDEEADEAVEAANQPILSVSIPATGARLYVGPKKFTLLRGLGSDLEKAVWFSSRAWMVPIVKAIFLSLLWIHDHTLPNYGLAIILTTVALRLLLFPVNQYSMVSMKKSQLQMQRVQPKVKAIRAKYKKSKDAQARAKMNQETMELYRKEGINPMGGLTGCLPLLAQFPILIGFYNMLTVAIELRGAPFFGWIQDLSREDPYWITPLLMGVTMFAQQKMAMSKIKDPQQLQQQRMMLFMPVMFTFICFGMPSGLVLYWFVNNVLGMGQQWLVNRHAVRLEAAANKA
jgi:YidC/Oxa1 family membrane protein insertase